MALGLESLPDGVAAALTRAVRHGFKLSCEPLVGRLLAILAAAVPPDGRILELGTGVGTGLAWIVHGLGSRTDVKVISVERNPQTATVAREGLWPASVELLVGDAELLLPRLGEFDLIFADAEGGKWTGLNYTLAALGPRATLVVDDMNMAHIRDHEHRAAITRVREQLVADPRLVTVELALSSGIIVAVRRP